MAELKIDKSCIPYPRKGLYWMINIPYLVLLILTTIYLWNYNILVSSIYISFYVISTILHGYICSFSDCPYIGTMCPGAFAWFPVGKIARLFQKLKFGKSALLINLFFLLIMFSLIGMITLPLYWISKLGIIYSVKNTDRYIIAGDSIRKRETLKEDMSKSFTHYYKFLGNEKELSFRNLRKTYVTLVNNFTNGQAEVITGHSGQGIIMKSYHDQKVFNHVLDNFRLIG